MMSEQLRVAPNICTCGESSPGTVIVFHGVTEHHCLPPAPCFVDVGSCEVDDKPFVMTKEELEKEYSRIVEGALKIAEYDICESFQRACEKVAPDWTFKDCELIGTTLYISALPPDLISLTINIPKEQDA